MKPLIIFPSRPDSNLKIDPTFEAEYAAALAQSSLTAFFEPAFDAKEDGLRLEQLRKVFSGSTVIYRGWMKSFSEYVRMKALLESADLYMINTATQYRTCHHLPRNYYLIKEQTPKAIFFPWSEHLLTAEFMFNMYLALEPHLEKHPLIVKDYVKSEKEHWDSACLIPRFASLLQFSRVVEKFFTLRRDRFTEGFVFREYVPLAYASDSRALEYRLWFCYHTLFHVSQTSGPSRARELGQFPPLERFSSVATTIPSNFFTMDVALRETGEWIIIELGDGQVAGYPLENLSGLEPFYRALNLVAQEH